MKTVKERYSKILIIIRRTLGDVLLMSPLVNLLHRYLPKARIDLLVNDDTIAMASAIKHVTKIHSYSYQWRKKGWKEWIRKEFYFFKSITGKYDLAISLTINERSSICAALAGRVSIAASNKTLERSWWRKIFLTHTYLFEADKHICLSNFASLESIRVPVDRIEPTVCYRDTAKHRVKKMLKEHKIREFIVFHPSTRYNYKIYPQNQRNELLLYLSTLNISIVITGGKSDLDRDISNSLPILPNIYNFIGRTTLEEVIALTDLSLGYIGMDTVNMHIAAALNKRVIAIFGPTLPQMFSPWSNTLQTYTKENRTVQRYGNITLIQADMPCVACGLAGCDDKNSISECLYEIAPETIFKEVKREFTMDGFKMAETV